MWARFHPAVLLRRGLLGATCGSQTSRRPADMLRAQLDDDWKYWMSEYPELATSIGYPGQNRRWTDYSQTAIDARAARLKTSLQRLSGIDRGPLDQGDQLSFDLYRELLETAIKGLDFQNDAVPIRGVVPHNLLMPINQLEGIQQDIPRTLALMPTATRDDYENIVSRLEGVGAVVDQTIALMGRGLAAGMTPPAVTLRDVPEQVKAQISDDPLKSPMLAAFAAWPPSIPEADRASLIARATTAYAQRVVPAFRKLHDFLTSIYLPACRTTTSASALANGASMYAYNVKWHVTTDMTPQQIHELGLSEVRRIRREMDQVIASSGFHGSYAEFATFLRTAPRFSYPAASSLLSGYRDIAKRAYPELPHLCGRLPQTPYGVKPVPDAVAPSQTTAYYEQGSLAAARRANMFAHTFKLDARPKW